MTLLASARTGRLIPSARTMKPIMRPVPVRYLVAADVYDGYICHFRSLGYDPLTGLWWAGYSKSKGGCSERCVAYSDNGGRTWQGETQLPGYDTTGWKGSPAVCARDGVCHVGLAGRGQGDYPDKGQVMYWRRESGAWAMELVTNVDGYQSGPSNDVDGSGDVHLLWDGAGYGTYPTRRQVVYRKRASGVWQPPDILTDIDRNQSACGIRTINGTVHVMYGGPGHLADWWREELLYRQYTTAWGAPEYILENTPDVEERGLYLCFDVSPDGSRVDVVTEGHDGSYNYVLWHRRRTSEGWGAWEQVPTGFTNVWHPTVTFLDNDNLLLVFHRNTGTKNEVYYMVKGTSGWGSPVLLTADMASADRCTLALNKSVLLLEGRVASEDVLSKWIQYIRWEED